MARAQRKSLNPIIGLMMRLMARWSCSMMLFRYLFCRTLDQRWSSGVEGFEGGKIGAALVHGDRFGLAVPVNRFLEVAARCGLVTPDTQQESTVSPALSTARYKYFHWPLTLT